MLDTQLPFLSATVLEWVSCRTVPLVPQSTCYPPAPGAPKGGGELLFPV